VFAPAGRCRTPEARAVLCRAVEWFAPAHTEATVEFVAARFRVGIQATIGVDTAIGHYPPGVTLGDARLNRDAVIQVRGNRRGPAFRVGRHSLIGGSTL